MILLAILLGTETDNSLERGERTAGQTEKKPRFSLIERLLKPLNVPVPPKFSSDLVIHADALNLPVLTEFLVDSD